MFDRAGGLSDTTTVPWLRSQVTQLAVCDVRCDSSSSCGVYIIPHFISLISDSSAYMISLTYLLIYLLTCFCSLPLYTVTQKWTNSDVWEAAAKGGISVGSRGMWSLRWKGNQKYGFFRNTLTFAIFVTRSTCNSSFLVSFL